MNNETKLLAISLLAILEDMETSYWFSIQTDLKLLTKFNTEEIIEKTEDIDGVEIEQKTNKIINTALDKIISRQSEEIAKYYNNERDTINKKFSHNTAKINIIKDILAQVLEKEVKKEQF